MFGGYGFSFSWFNVEWRWTGLAIAAVTLSNVGRERRVVPVLSPCPSAALRLRRGNGPSPADEYG